MRLNRRNLWCAKNAELKPCPTVCLNCGEYKGRQVIDVLAKLNKKEKKLKSGNFRKKKANNI